MSTYRNTGPSAPASPAATNFTPFVGELGGKPVLIWGQTSSGLARIKNPDFTHNPSAVPVDRIPAHRHLEVVEGKKSRYAVIKGGYLDLATGQTVNDEIKAAINKYREAKAPAPVPAPAPAPTPVVAPAPVSPPAPADVSKVAAAPAFSWKDWWKVSFDQAWPTLYSDAEPAWDWEEAAANTLCEMAAAGVDALLAEVKEAIQDYDISFPEMAKLAQEAHRLVLQFAQASKADIERSQKNPSHWEGNKEEFRWFPLTTSFPLSWELNVEDEIRKRMGATVATVMVDPDGGFECAITPKGEILFAKVGDDVAASVHVRNLSFVELRNNKDALDFLLRLVQETFGYHPNQLTLF